MRCSRVSPPLTPLHKSHTYSLCSSAPDDRLLVQAAHLSGGKVVHNIPCRQFSCSLPYNCPKFTPLITSCCLLLHADSSVPYLKPYYDELRDWQPPSDPLVKPMPGQKRKARLPVGWVMVYRHLSGKGSHPRPFDQGLSKNLELFFFTPKPCVHKAQFEPGTMITGRAAGSDQV